MQNLEKLLTNKKALIAIAAVIFIIVVCIIAIPLSSDPTNSNEITDSTSADNDLEIQLKLEEENPISELLPIINETPYYYYIGPYFDVDENNNVVFALEIAYRTVDGKNLALSRLKKDDLAKYNPSQYKIKYTIKP